MDTASLIEYDENLIFVYHDDFPTTRYIRRSFDGGQSWTEPKRLFSHVGSNGPASMVIDNGENLHMIFGNRVFQNNQDIHGMWHSIWQDDQWQDPLVIASGPPIRTGPLDMRFDPSFANAVISQGDTLLVVWRTDPLAGENGIWYSYRRLDVPALPIIALPVSSSEIVLEDVAG